MIKLSNLTVLSFGGGQDSTAILLMMITSPNLRQKYAPGKLIVVMSDTGDEHPYTYEHIKNIEKICLQEEIPFFFLTSDKGYHTPAWPNLIEPQMRDEGGKYKPTMVQLKTKSCTDKLKLVPIYKFVDEYINTMMNYGMNLDRGRGHRKAAIKRFYKENGKIRVLIGFAKGEEKRSTSSDKLQARQYASENDLWEKAIFRQYPLIEEGMDRFSCQEFITKNLGYSPMPSNCMRCPYQSDQEVLWLHRNYPEKFQEWVEIERRKIARFEGKTEKNHGVYNSKKTLVDKLNQAIEKYGEWTNKQLSEYKMSHGCATNSI